MRNQLIASALAALLLGGCSRSPSDSPPTQEVEVSSDTPARDLHERLLQAEEAAEREQRAANRPPRPEEKVDVEAVRPDRSVPPQAQSRPTIPQSAYPKARPRPKTGKKAAPVERAEESEAPVVTVSLEVPKVPKPDGSNYVKQPDPSQRDAAPPGYQSAPGERI
ncbi:MAG: hypothetical protein AB7S38_42570 [Vulcanimicrobiota bacterium]